LSQDNEKAADVPIEAAKIFVPDAVGLYGVDDGKSYTLQIQRQAGPDIDVKTFGAAAERVIGLSLALVSAHDGVFLIDEIENSLHWTVLPFVWKFLLDYCTLLHIQLVAVTQSIECIRAFYAALKEAEEDSAQVIRMEKRQEGTHAEIFDVNRLAVVVEEGIEIR
jgi:hypothetical protein